MSTHTADCRWNRTPRDECEYRETHHYCPHPEHACDCNDATPEPSAAAQPNAPCLHVPGIGEPECSCAHCRSYGGHPCPRCRQPKTDLAEQMQQAWLADNPGLREALDRRTQPAAPQAEGEGASGAGVDDLQAKAEALIREHFADGLRWLDERSGTYTTAPQCAEKIHALYADELASLRADRDRLETRTESLEENQAVLRGDVQRLERELEEARRERDGWQKEAFKYAAMRGTLRAKAQRVMDMLEKHGASIVPHLLDTDDNPGEFLRAELRLPCLSTSTEGEGSDER